MLSSSRPWLSSLVLTCLAACAVPRSQHGSQVHALAANDVPLSFAKGKAASSYSNDATILVDDDFVIRADLPSQRYSAPESNVYYASFSNPDVIIQLSSYGKVEYKDRQRMVLRIDHPDDVMAASILLHEMGGAKCGGLRQVPLTPVVPINEDSSLGLVDPGNLVKNAAIEALTRKIDPEKIRSSITRLVSLGSRLHSSQNGKKASDWVADQGYQPLVGNRSDVTVEKITHRFSTQQNSVIARIKGSKQPDKIIIVGSHLDSVSSSTEAPGADDNASGTSTLIEAFRVLMEARASFDYTVEFHAYAAEEAGLLGSAEIAANYRNAGKDVVAMVQFDMTAFSKNAADKKIWLVSNNTNATLNGQLEKLVALYVGVPTERRPLFAGTSDHASWMRNGFKAAFPFENPTTTNPHIHSRADTLDKLDMDYAANFGKLLIAYVSHFAGLQEQGTVGGGTSSPAASQELFLALGQERTNDSYVLTSAGPTSVSKMALCHGKIAECRSGSSVAFELKWLKQQANHNFFAAAADYTPANGRSATLLAYDTAGTLQWVREITFEAR